MGLFNLGDISFNGGSGPSTGALAGTQYGQNTYRFPSDLGASDKAHYILININEQINTNFAANLGVGTPTVFSNQAAVKAQVGNTLTTQLASDVSAALLGAATTAFKKITGSSTGDAAVSGLAVGAGLAFYQNSDLKTDPNIGVRTIRRTADTIALYMPDSLSFSYAQGYSELKPGGTLTQGVLSGLSSVSDSWKNSPDEKVSAMFAQGSPFLQAALASQFGDVGKILFTAASGGKVQNPMLEILYSSPEFRTFKFDFLMFPRSEKEAEEVQKIIDRLRFAQAPELVQGSGGFFMYPPSEFDISFYYNGTVNPNIPKISTCVLTNIDTDYTPNGFSAYESYNDPTPRIGRTGMPVGIRMSLTFKETEYLTKNNPLIDGGTGVNPKNSYLLALDAATSGNYDASAGGGRGAS
jgi:hypothetical protein